MMAVIPQTDRLILVRISGFVIAKKKKKKKRKEKKRETAASKHFRIGEIHKKKIRMKTK